jgi:HK97 family phage prohead protease
MDDAFDVEVVDGQPSVNGLFVRSVEAMDGTFKDVDEGRREVLVEFPHERVDTYKTTFGNDCFRDSFANRMPVMCWQHDLREPIGRAISAQVTPRANELVGKLDDFDAVPLARRAFTQIQSGTLTDFSFGFKDPQYEPHPQHRGVRRIKRATMKEFSPVTVGSIPGAIATGTREEEFKMERSVEEIIQLRTAGLIEEDEAAAIIKELLGGLGEHIDLGRHRSGAKPVSGQMMPDGTFVPDESQDGARDDEDEERINAATIVAKLPESWQRQMAEADARVYLVLGDEEWGPIDNRGALDETASELLAQVDAACRSAAEWLSRVDQSKFSDELHQAIGLYRAAGNAADALMDATETERADPGGPGDDDTEKGDDMVTCPTCDGKGTIREGHMKCPTCKGAGKVTQEVADENRGADVDFLVDGVRFVSVAERKTMAKSGVAMPNGDFPIPDKGHLSSAIGHLGNYLGDKKSAAAHIKKRAKALGVDIDEDALDAQTRASADDDDDSLQDKVHEAGYTPTGEEEEVTVGKTDEESEEEEGRAVEAALKRLERHSPASA